MRYRGLFLFVLIACILASYDIYAVTDEVKDTIAVAKAPGDPCDPYDNPTDLSTSFEPSENVAWNDPCWEIRPQKKTNKHSDWQAVNGGVEPGSYCLVKLSKPDNKSKVNFGSSSLLISRPIEVPETGRYLVSFKIYRESGKKDDAGMGLKLYFISNPDLDANNYPIFDVDDIKPVKLAKSYATHEEKYQYNYDSIPVSINGEPTVEVGWYEYEARIPDIMRGKVVYIIIEGFHRSKAAGGQKFDIKIDDLQVTEIPLCNPVTNLTISKYDPNNDEITVSWTPVSEGDSLLLEYTLTASGGKEQSGSIPLKSKSSYTFDKSFFKKKEDYELWVSIVNICSPIDRSEPAETTFTFTATCPDLTVNLGNTTICPKGSYLFNDECGNQIALEKPGQYTGFFPNDPNDGCGVTRTVNLIVWQQKDTVTIDTTICPGDLPFEFMDEEGKAIVDEEGIAIVVKRRDDYSFESSYSLKGYCEAECGCDSIVYLKLNVLPEESRNETVYVHAGDPYLVPTENGFIEYGSNTGPHRLIGGETSDGCDSVINLYVKAIPVVQVDSVVTICPDSVLDIYDRTYSISNLRPGESKILDKINIDAKEPFGLHSVDSVVNLEIKFYEQVVSTYERFICKGDSITEYLGLNGRDTVIKTTGSYKVLSRSKPNGCKQYINLTVKFFPSNNNNEFLKETVCKGAVITGYVDEKGDAITINTDDGTTEKLYKVLYTDSNGCQYKRTLQVTVTPPIVGEEISEVICSGKSFLFGGVERTESGDYTHVFKSKAGCDSTVTLHLTVTPPNVGIVKATICDNGSYPFNGTAYTEAGTFDYKTKTAEGCDSIARLVLTVNPTYNEEIHGTICSGKSFLFGGVERTEVGDYTHIFKSKDGCDSIVTLHLTVNPAYNEEISETICSGKSFLFGGEERTESDDYTHIFKSKGGCDSTVTLHLTVTPPDTGVVNATICQGDEYEFNGTKYSVAGTYDYKTKTAEGCDSIARLVLTVNPVYNHDVYETICSGHSYSFGPYTFTESVIETHKFASKAGCDSTVTLHLTVTPPIVGEEKATICQGEVYLFNGIGHTEANTYSYPLKTAEGCDSIARLILTVKPIYPDVRDTVEICQGESHSFGPYLLTVAGDYTYTFPANDYRCDSTVNLHLVVKPVYNHEVYETVCSGNSFPFGGENFSVTGVYTHKFISKDGCDSTVTLHLTVTPAIVGITTAAICDGEEYEFNGTKYSVAGTYDYKTKTAEGCDSIARLVLTVNPTYNEEIHETICSGKSFLFGGEERTESGDYTYVFKSKGGCDSTVTLHLTVTPPNVGIVKATICDNESYPFNGTAYTEAGTYDYKTKTAEGCDSIARLVLTVNPTYSEEIHGTICSGKSFLFGGVERTEAGDYTHVFKSKYGCDSIVTLHLTVNPAYNEEIHETICSDKSFLFGGEERTESGDYTYVFKSKGGCDSTVTLHLTVTPPDTGVVNATICQGEKYEFNGTKYTEAGTYDYKTQTTGGCDSIARLVLAVNQVDTTDIKESICYGDTYLFNGIKQWKSGIYLDTLSSKVTGCDSILRLELTVGDLIEKNISVSVCSGESYDFYGRTLTESTDTCTHLLKSVAACDTLVLLDFRVYEKYDTIVYSSICYGGEYHLGDTILKTDTTLTKKLISSHGCDSIVTLHLSVNPVYDKEITDTVCYGEEYKFGNVEVDTKMSGDSTYQYTFMSKAGCDSTVTLRLYVRPLNSKDFTHVMCEGDMYEFEGNFYTESGTYDTTYIDRNGCDSIVTLHLTVKSASRDTVYDSICEGNSYLFGGKYISPGTYSDTLGINANGCDSIRTLVLTENPVYNIEVSTSICEGDLPYQFGTQTLTKGGEYTETFKSKCCGCDSTVNLTLTVYTPQPTIDNVTICANGSYDFYGEKYTKSGSYKQQISDGNGCEAFHILNLTVLEEITTKIDTTIKYGETYLFNGETLSAAGQHHRTQVHKAANGCDSTVVLDLTIEIVSDTTIYAAICPNSEYMYNGVKYEKQGIYVDTVHTVNGDSVVAIELSWLPDYNDTIVRKACLGDTIMYNGAIYDTTGFYPHLFESKDGCDSIVTIYFEVLKPVYTYPKVSICHGETYLFGDTVLQTSGTYKRKFVSLHGCDSIVYLSLNVNLRKASKQDVTIFDYEGGYEFGDKIYTQSGVYRDTLTSNGCDSIVELTLTVVKGTSDTTKIERCEGDVFVLNDVPYDRSGTYNDTIWENGTYVIKVLELTFNPKYTFTTDTVICAGDSCLFAGEYYSEQGIYYDTLQSSAGCDSIFVLNLTVLSEKNIIYQFAEICDGDTYSFAGEYYSEQGIYYDTLQSSAGCDSIVALILRVNPVYNNTVYESICEGGSYLFAGKDRTESGRYVDSAKTISGCDSITTLILTVNKSYNNTVSATICANETYSFCGVEYNTSGLHQHRYESKSGCDSVMTLNLTVLPAYNFVTTATICDGESYDFREKSYNKSGTYHDSLKSVVWGCDSVYTLELTVNPSYNDTVYESICEGEKYRFGGVDLTESGTYVDSAKTSLGCNLITTLILTVHKSHKDTVYDTICSGETYIFGPNKLNSSYEGFTHRFTSKAGCDSIVTLYLTVLNRKTESVFDTICKGEYYTFGDTTLARSGVYYDFLKSSNGCDSMVALYLTVAPSYSNTIRRTICEGGSYPFAGKDCTKSGIYVDSAKTALGCDSIITLILTVNKSYNDTVSATICADETYSFCGKEYNSTGFHTNKYRTKFGCDSIKTLNLTVLPVYNVVTTATICDGESYGFRGEWYDKPGIYHDSLKSVVGGCDSVYTLQLTVNPSYHNVIYDTICEGEKYRFDGVDFMESVIYESKYTTTLGCDSIIKLHLKVNPIQNVTLSESICEGDVYQFGDTLISESGEYVKTFVSSEGCDSTVTLILTVISPTVQYLPVTTCSNEPYEFGDMLIDSTGIYIDTIPSGNGCFSYLILNLTVNPAYSDTIYDTICAGESRKFAGNYYYTSNTYVDSAKTKSGCDSITTLILTVNPVYDLEFDVLLCGDETYLFGDALLTATGSYSRKFVSSHGCDSIVTINVEKKEYNRFDMQATICDGESYPFFDRMISDAGVYYDTINDGSRCGLVVSLDLAVAKSYCDTTYAAICEGETFRFENVEYGSTGIYSRTYMTKEGCDSTLVLNLKVNPSYKKIISVTTCQYEPYLFAGKYYDETGVYGDTLKSVDGCDSITELHLTVIPNEGETINSVICYGETYNFIDTILDASGVYTRSLPSGTGCDYVVTLNLTVLDEQKEFVDVTMCSGGSYYFGGVYLSESGTYIDSIEALNGCDSVLVLNLLFVDTVYSYLEETICEGESYRFGNRRLTEAGVYCDTLVAKQGCDSIVTLTLAVASRFETTTTLAVFEGERYIFGSQLLTRPGTYKNRFTASNGCDSVVTLNFITVKPGEDITRTFCYGETFKFNGTVYSSTGVYEVPMVVSGVADTITLDLTFLDEIVTEISATICYGDKYMFGDKELGKSGDYSRKLVSEATGCDSIVKLNLTLLPENIRTVDTTICYGERFAVGGVYHTESGVYNDTLTGSDVNGCDSIISWNLTVLPRNIHIVDTTICFGEYVEIGGVAYYESGLYEDIILPMADRNGCDSIVTLNLTVRDEIKESYKRYICDGSVFEFGSQLLTEPGVYTEVFESAAGCDSTVTMTIVVFPVYNDTIRQTICTGVEYEFAGAYYDKSGVYYDSLISKQYGCDSVTTLILEVTPPVEVYLHDSIRYGAYYELGAERLTKAGKYRRIFKDEDGCDSIVNLTLDVHYDTFREIYVAPSPIGIGQTTYVYDNFTAEERADLEVFVYNSIGELVQKFIKPTQFPIPIEGLTSTGVYLVRYITLYGETFSAKFIVR